MASIAYLQLDTQNDPLFADGTSLTNGAAVAQAVLTRLRLFLGEWWENLNLGLPVFQQMLGQLGSQRGLRAMQLAIQQNITGFTPYVTAVTNVEVGFINGQLSYTANVQTIYGPVTISNVPALGAVIASVS
jgi:hypothetical protein